ncbi:MAG: acyl-CoA dehydratase activase [Thermodesulfobacteriota bacterium]
MLQDPICPVPLPRKKSSDALRSLGICIGGSSVSAAMLALPDGPGRPGGEKPCIEGSLTLAHEGNPKAALHRLLSKVSPERFDRIAVTGRRFHHNLNLSGITEPEAVEHAYRFVRKDGVSSPAVVSAGGETFMVYVLSESGSIVNVLTGNKCASGTGEFFLQQLRRMDTSLADAASWAVNEEPYQVSGRCSVFCKSDCTHATNKGIPKPRVVAGLCRMMAQKILELLKKVPRENIMLVGGTSKNRMMVHFLAQEIPGLIVPDEAPFFEALGAALWGLSHRTLPFPGRDRLFSGRGQSFQTLPPLADSATEVTFNTMERASARPGDTLFLGLDVGSTTTKAVLVRDSDNRIVASDYLRTNGDPVGASRRCYRSLLDQLSAQADPASVSIQGLGVCGSGRQIAGLHAKTDGVINEIIAHATAAVFFDPKVDTIFEIGGQDAKYTYLVNGVPADYAMNEACSAGTGSFLEESAWETLGVKMEDIAGIARSSRAAPNFNDQCAAFIASDIKNAVHEGLAHEDIVAGLVYSICMNYANRVKGARPVGERVFMQGGVCYNSAVPLAMATLSGKRIVVPPEPGLMGAFGVALEVKKRMASGLLGKGSFDLEALCGREVSYEKAFSCAGGKDGCDRRCKIEVVSLEGERFPFGGACNRYDNLRRKKSPVTARDLVSGRREIFARASGIAGAAPVEGPTIAFNRSFLTHTFLPLYATFFKSLGVSTVLPEIPTQEGVDRRNAPFCYPAELSHGFFHAILAAEKAPDFIFLPHFRAVPDVNGRFQSQVCPFVQAEPFTLSAAFSDEIADLASSGTRLLKPLVDLTLGLSGAQAPLGDCARSMGYSDAEIHRAFEEAKAAQEAFAAETREKGARLLARLSENPDRIAVAVFGRPYNAFVPEANKGIPRKLCSRDIDVVPFDFLSLDPEQPKEHMYWGMGQRILKAARLVKRHPQLFGLYITNFSCGPDSFILTYFRDIFGRKPSLTLELDSHTADAGLETRIEAFLDIVSAYRKLVADKSITEKPRSFVPATAHTGTQRSVLITSDGQELSMEDPAVTVLFPSMGRLAAETIGAVFRSLGYHTEAHPPADEAVLKLGRANTSCKECLPLILTTGTLLSYVQNRRPGEKVVYFLPTASGPCRFGQYKIFLEDLVRRLEIPDVAFWSPTSDNSYEGIGEKTRRVLWRGVVISDVMEDIWSMLLANARDPETALEVFEKHWGKIRKTLAVPGQEGLMETLSRAEEAFRKIPLKRPVAEVPVVSLVGEIFVRKDGISRQNLTERLAQKGIAVACAPIAEWVHYVRYDMEKMLKEIQLSEEERRVVMADLTFVDTDEAAIKQALASSGLVSADPVELPEIIEAARPYISPDLSGEAILTIGSALREVGHKTCGAIAIGPFGCMPNRVSEAILSFAMTHKNGNGARHLPFLAIESDGSPFPQLLSAKIEAFCLRAMRLHEKMRAEGRKNQHVYDFHKALAEAPVSP